MNNYTALALESWYTPEHQHYRNPAPAVEGLAGECGELIDYCKKATYKPGVEFDRTRFLDELGDVWWYLRIVIWLYGYSLEELLNSSIKSYTENNSQAELLAKMNFRAAWILLDSVYTQKWIGYENLLVILRALLELLALLDSDLDELTALNYAKLNQPEQNGWKLAR